MVDVIVVGAGHAGVEAALVCARQNKRVKLITLSKDTIAKMPCNPSIGGPAKGIVVREIDALGGVMGKVADKTALQVKMLNLTKGPGVHSLRVQSDKIEYSKMMREICEKQANLEIVEGIVTGCIIENNVIKGVRLKDGKSYFSKVTILTTGTYMSSLVLVGDSKIASGPDNEQTTNELSESLRENNIELFRLKTGTPPRIKKDSIDYDKTSIQSGTDEFYTFSYDTLEMVPLSLQKDCYLTHTTASTHKIILDNLKKSSMYSGNVVGVGPRYCPSIEDKLVRFKDKERHQLFLEPESIHLDTIYLQGFSSSMPHDIQEEMVHSLIGLENAEIVHYAYAIEYDAINPKQLKQSLELKSIENLFTAGQINGTSGYEEAAGQGLMAGINAVLKLDNKDPFVLRRDEAYIGVMIDDLVTKGTKEPYRLLTSRAEYRLLLRHDNADQRLLKKAFDLKIIDDIKYQRFLDKMQKINDGKELLLNTTFSFKGNINELLRSLKEDIIKDGISAYDLLKRPKVTCNNLSNYLDGKIDNEIGKQIDIEVKYEGYITKAKKEADRLLKMDKVKLPLDLNYNELDNISLEAKQKLSDIRPETMGQASRISGINPSDIATLAMALKIRRDKHEN
ncbi:MAG: tRNA uridine-5-carboxymethylaminomethyl(34) synthesis enzyme MnmG [Anaerorhabdus sp.]